MDLLASMIVWSHPVMYVGVGNIIAAILSYKRNKDFLWPIIAFLIGWPYVVYWILTN